MSDLQWNLTTFERLTVRQLYAVLKLRQDVFVVEQQCAYPDMDDCDQQAVHLLATDDAGRLVACARLFAPGVRFPEASIGRVIVAESGRGTGTGHELMTRSVAICRRDYGNVDIRIDAQAHLQTFYEQHQFVVCSQPHMVDGILHVTMRRAAD